MRQLAGRNRSADDLVWTEPLSVAVHAVRPPAGAWPRDYQSWATEEKRRVPPWAADPAAHREAFARLREHGEDRS